MAIGIPIHGSFGEKIICKCLDFPLPGLITKGYIYIYIYIALVAFKLNVPSDENESWTLWACKSLEQCSLHPVFSWVIEVSTQQSHEIPPLSLSGNQLHGLLENSAFTSMIAGWFSQRWRWTSMVCSRISDLAIYDRGGQEYPIASSLYPHGISKNVIFPPRYLEPPFFTQSGLATFGVAMLTGTAKALGVLHPEVA